MTTNSNVLRRNTFRNLRSPGVLAKWPMIGLIMFLLGGIAFSALAYSVMPHGPLVQWDMATAKTIHATAKNISSWIIEYILFGFFLGKEIIIMIGTILMIYFLYKRFWREAAMVLVGLGRSEEHTSELQSRL